MPCSWTLRAPTWRGADPAQAAPRRVPRMGNTRYMLPVLLWSCNSDTQLESSCRATQRLSAPLPSTWDAENIFSKLDLSTPWYICSQCSASEVRMWRRILLDFVWLQLASHMRVLVFLTSTWEQSYLCLTDPSGHNIWAFSSHRVSLPTGTLDNRHMPTKKHVGEQSVLLL